MNIPCAFIMGTKIKNIEVPAEIWTKVTTIPVGTNPDPTNYPTQIKAAGVYNGKIYEIDGNQQFGSNSSPSSFQIHIYNGTSWGTISSFQVPYYEWDWSFCPGGAVFVEYNGKLYLFNSVRYRYSLGSGTCFCYCYDGTSWTQVTPEGNWWPLVVCAVPKGDKLYLFTASSQGSWNPTYWYVVYVYDSTTNTLSAGPTSILTGYVQQIPSNLYTGGFRQIVYYNNKFHCTGTGDNGYGYVHVVDPDTWQIESSARVSSGLFELVVCKNKLHAFGPDVQHYVYNSVSGTWSSAEDTPYQRNPNQSADKYTKAIVYKNKLHIIGVQDKAAIPYPDSTSYDDMYKYNR